MQKYPYNKMYFWDAPIEALLCSYYQHGLNFFLAPAFCRSSLKHSVSYFHMPGKSMNELQGQNCEFWTKLRDANYSKSELKKQLNILADYGINRIDNAENLTYF